MSEPRRRRRQSPVGETPAREQDAPAAQEETLSAAPVRRRRTAEHAAEETQAHRKDETSVSAQPDKAPETEHAPAWEAAQAGLENPEAAQTGLESAEDARRLQAEEPGVSLQDARRSGAAQDRKRRDAEHKEQIRRVMMAVCLLTMAVSLVMIGSILVRSVRTHLLNRELAQKRGELIARQTAEPEETVGPEESIIPGETPAPEASEAPETEPAEEPEGPVPTLRPRGIVRNTQYHVASGTPLAHMEALYEENRDLIGWLKMEGILDLPVVYRDNTYYLNRDFYGKKNASGTIFLDEGHRFNEWTQTLLLHGHNMKDGSMFGRLTQYLNDVSYLKNNPFVHFDTLWREEQYVIFAVLNVSLDVRDEDFFNYFSYPTFRSDEEFRAFVRRAQLRSEYAIPIDVEPADALLMLSTCLDEDRLVILCRRVREGETRSSLRSSIRLSTRQ